MITKHIFIILRVSHNKNSFQIGSYFFKLFLKIVFEKIENFILVYFKNGSFSINLVKSMYLVFKKKKWESNFFSVFLFFKTKNSFQNR